MPDGEAFKQIEEKAREEANAQFVKSSSKPKKASGEYEEDQYMNEEMDDGKSYRKKGKGFLENSQKKVEA